MLLKDFKKSWLDLDYIQFATALVLDSCGELVAARAVLEMFGERVSCYDFSTIHSIRMKLDSYIQKTASPSKSSIDIFLEYINENKVLPVFKAKSYIKIKDVSLSELLVHSISLDAVAEKVAKMYCTIPRDKLIAKYVDSKLFSVEFNRFMKRRFLNPSNSSHRNILDTASTEEILNNFSVWFNKSCTNGSYSLNSGTPDAYIFRNDNSDNKGPISWYLCNQEFYDSLNSRGHNYTVSGGKDDKVALIDLESVDLSKNETPINFISICERINTASKLLFSHSDMPNAYYDIYTYHISLQLKDSYSEFKKVDILGYTPDIQTGFKLDAEYQSSTLQNKFNGRLSICDIFENVLKHGINKDEVYTKLYSSVIKVTDSLSQKDGVRLFSTPSMKTKHRESNGVMFQIILDGYIALRDLLKFLESDSNTLGISKSSFPVEIFRDRLLLRRVHSFEEYICYLDEIKELYDKAKNSKSDSNVLSNDDVFTILTQGQVLQSDLLLESIKNTSLSYVGTAVAERRDVSSSEDFCNRFVLARNNWINAIPNKLIEISQLEKLPPIGLESILAQMSDRILAIGVGNTSCLEHYANVINFANILRITMAKAENNPIVDENDFYLLTKPYAHEEAIIPDDLSAQMDNPVEILKKRMAALKLCMKILWGKPWDSNIFNISWEEFRVFWCSVSIVTELFKRIDDVFTELMSCSSDLALMLIKATAYSEILNIPLNVISLSELNYTVSERVQYYLLKEKPIDQIKELESSKNKILLSVLQRLHLLLKDKIDLFMAIYKRASVAFKHLDVPVVHDIQTQSLLEKASVNINSIISLDEETLNISKKLVTNYVYDKLGYIEINASRFVLNNSEYIHKDGYKVIVNKLINNYTVEVVNENDLIALSIHSSENY